MHYKYYDLLQKYELNVGVQSKTTSF